MAKDRFHPSSRGLSHHGMLSLLSHHPVVSEFHWDHSVWGSSWLFLIVSVLGYVISVQIVKMLLSFRRRPVPLGPIPALYNFGLLVASVVMFVGCLQSTIAEIAETRWLWQRSKTPFEWIICFPMGTRPAGRVFFWSYIFYLSKFYEFTGTFILLFQKQNLSTGHVIRNAMVVIMCFLWLQFAQSLQIFVLLSSTGLYITMYVYLSLCRMGYAPHFDNALRYCQIAQYVSLLLASIILIGLHYYKEGCSGMGAWLFGAFLDLGSLPFILVVNKQKKQKFVFNNTQKGSITSKTE